MRFQVPQFIEEETKIAGPLTFKQFALMGAAGVAIVILYAVFGKTHFLAFIFVSALLAISIFAIAFVRISGRSLPLVLGNFFIYSFSSRVYLWKKKSMAPRIIWKKLENKNTSINLEPPQELKTDQKSRLKRVSSIVETKK